MEKNTLIISGLFEGEHVAAKIGVLVFLVLAFLVWQSIKSKEFMQLMLKKVEATDASEGISQIREDQLLIKETQEKTLERLEKGDKNFKELSARTTKLEGDVRYLKNKVGT